MKNGYAKRFKFGRFKKIKDDSESFMFDCEHEVIGNIYANAEMVKEK